MMLAPTNEMAIGIKISDFTSDWCFIRSTTTAIVSPSPVATRGATMIHRSVLSKTLCVAGSVNANP